MMAPRRPAKYDDLLAVPETMIGEILFDRVVTHPRPGLRHCAANAALLGVLGCFFLQKSGRDSWIFICKPELHLGPHVVIPSLAAWRRPRLRLSPEAAWIDIAPDWICEVLSPETSACVRAEKGRIYASAGVPHVWHIDPVLRMLEVFELSEGKWLLLEVFRDDVEVKAAPFADPSFRLNLLWPLDVAPPAQDEIK